MQTLQPYIVDLMVLVIILFEFLMGLRRGLSGELFRLLGTGLVMIIALNFYEDFGLMIANHSRLTQNHEMAVALAFLLIVAGLGLCFLLLRIVFALIVNIKFNDAFDRPAGGAAGILRGCLIAGLLLFAASLWPNEQLRPWITVNSYAGKTVCEFTPVVKEKIRSWYVLAISSRDANARKPSELSKEPLPSSQPVKPNNHGRRQAEPQAEQ